MFKKFMLFLLCTLCFIVNISLFSYAAENDDLSIIFQIDNPHMTVNGVEKNIDENGTTPVIINGRTLLPVRAVVEEMGGSVDWNNTTKQVTLSNNNDMIVLTINSLSAFLNNEQQTLDTAPTIINGRTLLPIRFIAENFGYIVNWNANTKQVEITANKSETVTETQKPESTNKVLVAYFSATNTTKGVAENIADILSADLYEIVPEQPYTEQDLNYSDSSTRATVEMNDEAARPAISGSVENMEQYDIIFVGYPIWWGQAPKIMCTFLENYDFSGKTIIPFCTSGSSGMGSSARNLQSLTNNAEWLSGQRFSGGASKDSISSWIDGLNINP